jgi:hypothetical protein
MPITLVAQEAEIRRIVVQSQPGQIVLETLSQKKPSQKRVGRVVQGILPKFKPQYLEYSKFPDPLSYVDQLQCQSSI